MSKMGWATAFVITSSAAVSLLFVKIAKRPEPAVVRREVSQLSDVELNLILNRIREGDLLAIRGDKAAARAAWLEARKQGEGYWQIHEGIGDSYARFDLREEAIAEYAVAEQLVPEDLPTSEIRTKRALQLGEAGRFEEGFLALLELAHPKLLEFYEKGSDKARMLAALRERALTTDPRLLHPLWTILGKEGAKTEAARALARYAKAAVPWDAGIVRQAIEELRTEKLYEEAVEVCRAWARAHPENVDAYRAMGDLWREAGDTEKAYLAYTSMVDVRPGDADAHRALGCAFRDLKRYPEAIAQFEKSKRLRPEEPERWLDVAETVALTDAAEADRCYDEIAKKTWEPRFQEVLQKGVAVRYLRALEEARKAGDKSRVQELRRLLGAYHVPEGAYDLKVILTWDTPTDIDLDVIDPAGDHVHHGNSTSKAGGKYWVDDTSGHGPETFTLAKAAAGSYRIGAHFHSGSGRTTLRFQVILFEDTDREERTEHVLVLESTEEQKYLPDVALR